MTEEAGDNKTPKKIVFKAQNDPNIFTMVAEAFNAFDPIAKTLVDRTQKKEAWIVLPLLSELTLQIVPVL